MAEKLCELKKKGGGGSMSETVLWTNSNPTTAFAGQAVSLSQSINNFKYLKFTFYNGTSDTVLSESVISVEEFKKMTNDTSYNNFYRFSSPAYYYTNVGWVRLLFYSGDTSVNFSTVYKVNNSGTATNLLIPHQIIGLK